MSRTGKRAPAPRAQRLGTRRVIGLGASIAVIVAIAITINAAGQDQSAAPVPAAPSCGWDLTTPDGVTANAAYLTDTANWIADHGVDGGAPPTPTSPFWLGACPLPSGPPPGPPIGEANAPQ